MLFDFRAANSPRPPGNPSNSFKIIGPQEVTFSPTVRLRKSSNVSDDFLDPLFEDYFKKLQLPNLMRKTDYHELARLVPKGSVDKEIVAVLDRIVSTSRRARPKT
jgi:hypothetical protein